MAAPSKPTEVPQAVLDLPYFVQSPTIAQCRAAIENASGFREVNKDDYVLFNYDFCFRGSFPDPRTAPTVEEALLRQTRRECRGIIYNKETGKIISRRYHKFFNLNELDETHEDLIDVSRPHVILDKMDGCLVSPFMSLGKLRWGSKMGITELSEDMEEDFLPKKTDMKYHDFCMEWISKDYTPLFEWCSFKQQIIVSYPEDMLILTAIRHNETGMYVKLSEMQESAAKYNIPVTKPMAVSFGDAYKTLGELMHHVKESVGLEGFVLCFENGEYYKMKTEWYFARSKKVAGHFTGQEKELWDLILNRRIDDLGGALGPRRTEILERYSMQLWEALERSAKRVTEYVTAKKKISDDRKVFAQALDADIPKEWSGLYFKAFSGSDALELIVEKCKEYLPNRNKLERVRSYFAEGIKVDLIE